jgi:CheY-like chemotaxis protein
MNAKIMVADDDVDIREVIALVLQAYGFEALTAADGEEVLSAMQDHPDVRLLLLDLMMPRLSGRETMKKLKADPTLCKVPVVIISGDNDARDAASTLGAVAFLRKPIDLEALMAAVNRYTG